MPPKKRATLTLVSSTPSPLGNLTKSVLPKATGHRHLLAVANKYGNKIKNNRDNVHECDRFKKIQARLQANKTKTRAAAGYKDPFDKFAGDAFKNVKQAPANPAAKKTASRPRGYTSSKPVHVKGYWRSAPAPKKVMEAKARIKARGG